MEMVYLTLEIGGVVGSDNLLPSPGLNSSGAGRGSHSSLSLVWTEGPGNG
jgi:hypothetical protein